MTGAKLLVALVAVVVTGVTCGMSVARGEHELAFWKFVACLYALGSAMDYAAKLP